MLDPFRHVGDYGQPRTRLLPIGDARFVRRMVLISAGILAAMLLGVGAIGANAATTPQPSVHALMGAIKSGATMTIDRVTYQAQPVHCQREWGHNPGQRNHWHVFCQPAAGQHRTRGYTRTCRAFARWNAAGIPSWAQLRTLAHSAAVMGYQSLANDALRSAVAQLVLSVVGGVNGSGPAVIVGHDCGND